MAHARGSMEVELEGRGLLTIRPSDHVATGGEASVYRASKTSVKIYTDPTKMRRDGMVEKVKLLKPLAHKYVMAPEGVVRDTKGEPIGIYMPFAEGEALPRMFTTSFWQREGFTRELAMTLVDRMRDVTRRAHDHQAIMVDANELNWIAALLKGDPEPRAIDVDSWAIGRFGPKAIMPSVKDWHTKGFTAESDWFSFGIVSFQIFTGIHPYRGTLDGYTQKDLERRMQDNASVFSPGVRLNNAVRDFNTIPTPLLEWYKATFQTKTRSAPPSPFDKGVAAIAPAARIHKTVTTASGSLLFDKLFERAGDGVVRVWPCGAVLTASGAVVDIATKRDIGRLSSTGEVIKVDGGWVLMDPQGAGHGFTFVDDRTRQAQSLPVLLRGSHVLRYENRLFIITDTEMVELKFMNAGRPLLVNGPRTQVLQPHATKWFDGVGVQKAFDATFLVLPFGDTACVTVRTKELDGFTPVAAKAGNRFVTVVGIDKSGSYVKHELTFTADYRTYTAWQGATDTPELNVALLPKMVAAMVLDDGELTIFVPTNKALHKVKDRMVTADMVLANWDDTVVYVKDGALWSVRMKGP